MITPDVIVRSHMLQQGNTYHSPRRYISSFARALPSFTGYLGIFYEALRLNLAARKGLCDDLRWARASEGIFASLEHVGCQVHIEGLEHLAAMKRPCVFVGNHMSTLDAFGLPALIRSFMPVTPVVKRSLCTMPFFGPIMRSRDPIPVDRINPRDDFKAVMEGGKERLDRGISIIVFPQSTRSPNFDPQKFNSIGVKLAKHANVPIIPMAMRTDAWQPGKLFKDIGPIRPGIPIHFRFGAPLEVHGNGKKEQELICDFIKASLEEWGLPPVK